MFGSLSIPVVKIFACKLRSPADYLGGLVSKYVRKIALVELRIPLREYNNKPSVTVIFIECLRVHHATCVLGRTYDTHQILVQENEG